MYIYFFFKMCIFKQMEEKVVRKNFIVWEQFGFSRPTKIVQSYSKKIYVLELSRDCTDAFPVFLSMGKFNIWKSTYIILRVRKFSIEKNSQIFSEHLEEIVDIASMYQESTYCVQILHNLILATRTGYIICGAHYKINTWGFLLKHY